MNYVWDFAILTKYSHLFWVGLGWTIAYTVGTVLFGTLDRSFRRHSASGALARDRLAADRLYRTFPLHAALGPDHLVLLRVFGGDRRQHSGARRCRHLVSLYGGAFYAEIARGAGQQ